MKSVSLNVAPSYCAASILSCRPIPMAVNEKTCFRRDTDHTSRPVKSANSVDTSIENSHPQRAASGLHTGAGRPRILLGVIHLHRPHPQRAIEPPHCIHQPTVYCHTYNIKQMCLHPHCIHQPTVYCHTYNIKQMCLHPHCIHQPTVYIQCEYRNNNRSTEITQQEYRNNKWEYRNNQWEYRKDSTGV